MKFLVKNLSRKIIGQGCSGSRNTLIDTLTEKQRKFFSSEPFESVYQDDSWKYANFDYFRITAFNFEEPNTIFYSQVSFFN